MYLICETVHDGETFPAGTDVSRWPEGTLTSLRGINLLTSEAPGKPTPKTASDGNATPPVLTATAGGEDDRLPDDRLLVDLVEGGKISQKTVEILHAAEPPLMTIGDLRAYAAEHKKFEPLANIGRATSKALLQLIG